MSNITDDVVRQWRDTVETTKPVWKTLYLGLKHNTITNRGSLGTETHVPDVGVGYLADIHTVLRKRVQP